MEVAQITIQESVQLTYASVAKRSDMIIHIHYKKHSNIDVAQVEEVEEIVLRLLGNEQHGILVEADEMVHYTTEARALAAKKPFNPLKPAVAAIAKNQAQRLLANFYLRVNKPITPFRMFTDVAKAEEWLYSILDK